MDDKINIFCSCPVWSGEKVASDILVVAKGITKRTWYSHHYEPDCYTLYIVTNQCWRKRHQGDETTQ